MFIYMQTLEENKEKKFNPHSVFSRFSSRPCRGKVSAHFAQTGNLTELK